EIQIRDWCIGCGLCADQCPYDSIQMHESAIVPSGAPGWLWMDNASTSVDDNWNQSLFSGRQWRIGMTPFTWGIDLHLACSNGAQRKPSRVDRLYFLYRFRPRQSAGRSGASRHRLLITSQGASLEAFFNGQPLELKQDAAQKKRSQFVAEISGDALRSGDKVLAIAVAPPKEFGVTVLDAQIDTLAPESDDVEEKLVTERAVVCDQCSSLSGERHACVYACPHDAAIRIDSWVKFPAR
ncbi:MAG: 4Fe-4S binding protein, partial [Candidatus Udaeobacter sp.]